MQVHILLDIDSSVHPESLKHIVVLLINLSFFKYAQLFSNGNPIDWFIFKRSFRSMSYEYSVNPYIRPHLPFSIFPM